jgi:hypothetical protein
MLIVPLEVPPIPGVPAELLEIGTFPGKPGLDTTKDPKDEAPEAEGPTPLELKAVLEKLPREPACPTVIV